MSRGTNIGRVERTVVPVAPTQGEKIAPVPEKTGYELDLGGEVWCVGWAAMPITDAFFLILAFPLAHPLFPLSF